MPIWTISPNLIHLLHVRQEPSIPMTNLTHAYRNEVPTTFCAEPHTYLRYCLEPSTPPHGCQGKDNPEGDPVRVAESSKDGKQTETATLAYN